METEIKKINQEQEARDLETELMSEITAIVKEHEASLLRYAARIIRDLEHARDIVQEAFIKLIKFRQKKPFWKGKSNEIENVKAWLYKITRNLCLDHLRSSRVKLEIPIDEKIETFAGKERPDITVEKKELMQLVRQQIMAMDPRSREILILKLEHGKSYKEIAGIMKLSTGNVGFILHESMKKIASELRDKVRPAEKVVQNEM